MKTKKQSFCKALFLKIALLTALILGGGNFMSLSAQKSLPYEYGFENNDLATEGWTVIDGYTGALQTKIYNATTAYTHTGSYHFRFISYEVEAQYLISPELESSSADIEVSFYYRTYGNTDTEKFCVGYSSTNNLTSSFTWSSEESYTSSTYTSKTWVFPSGTKYIAIKSTTNTSNSYRYLFIDDITIEENNPYKVPTSFALDSYTASSATFSWTAGNSETAWQFAYSTSSDFTPGTGGTTLDITTSDLSDGKYTLTGLTDGTTYYAAIRADYGSGNYSEWTDKLEFTPRAEIDVTINESSTANAYGLIYTSSIKNYLIRSQIIIPSASLSEINGRQITKLIFYSSTSSSDLGGGKFEIYLKEVSGTSYSSTKMSDWGTKVYGSSTLSISSNIMVVNLDTPFNYNGGNLQIGFKQTAKASSSPYISWYCVTGITNSSRQSTDDDDATYNNKNPKMTITSIPITTAPVQMGANGYTTFACPRPLDLSSLPEGLTAYKATVDAANSRVLFTKMDQTVPANTGMLLEGTAGKTYAIPVADSGTTPDGNVFLVNSTGGTFSADGDYTYFAMKKASSASDIPIFATFNPSSVAIPADKTYLKILTTSLGDEARQLICVFNEEGGTTGINTVQGEGFRKNSFYNLQGQRVDNPTKGLYIKDGKKVMVK